MTFQDKSKLPVGQSTYRVADEDSVIFTAVLGSCVAVCAYDETTKVGGMNHILLPGEFGGNLNESAAMYGANLMELLLNDMVKAGARRRNLKYKLFGGAKVLRSEFDVGQKNIDFVMQYVENENLNVVSSSLGGRCGRRLEFHPASGMSRQKLLADAAVPAAPVRKPEPVVNSGEMELF